MDVVPLSSMDDEALQKASRDNTWALTLRELHCIRDQFATPDEQARRKAAGLPADPTDVEMEVLAQTWSEHCKHKIFASRIHYENKETGQREEVNNLYKTCIRDATAAIRKRLGDDDYCKSVFKDNAGRHRLHQRLRRLHQGGDPQQPLRPGPLRRRPHRYRGRQP